MSLVNAGTGRSPLSATASSDGTFEIGGIVPGPYRLEASMPGPARWWLRSAVANGQDLLDFPPTFDAGTGDVAGVVLTFSDRFTELVGTLHDPAGLAATGPVVLVFPADRRFWRPRARRVAWTRPDTGGGFTVRGLPPGDYLVVVLDAQRAETLGETAAFDPLVAGALRVTLAEGERTGRDLRIPNGAPIR